MPNIKGAVAEAGKKAGETAWGCIVKILTVGVVAVGAGFLISIALIGEEGDWQIITVPVNTPPAEGVQPNPQDYAAATPDLIKQLKMQVLEEGVLYCNILEYGGPKEAGACPLEGETVACVLRLNEETGQMEKAIVDVPNPDAERPEDRMNEPCIVR